MGEMEGGVAGEVVNGSAANTTPWQKLGSSVAQGGPPIAVGGGGGGGGRTGCRRWDLPPQSVIATPGTGGKGEGVGRKVWSGYQVWEVVWVKGRGNPRVRHKR